MVRPGPAWPAPASRLFLPGRQLCYQGARARPSSAGGRREERGGSPESLPLATVHVRHHHRHYPQSTCTDSTPPPPPPLPRPAGNVYRKLMEIESRLLPCGLHVVGCPPTAEEAVATLVNIAELDRPGGCKFF